MDQGHAQAWVIPPERRLDALQEHVERLRGDGLIEHAEHRGAEEAALGHGHLEQAAERLGRGPRCQRSLRLPEAAGALDAGKELRAARAARIVPGLAGHGASEGRVHGVEVLPEERDQERRGGAAREQPECVALIVIGVIRDRLGEDGPSPRACGHATDRRAIHFDSNRLAHVLCEPLEQPWVLLDGLARRDGADVDPEGRIRGEPVREIEQILPRACAPGVGQREHPRRAHEPALRLQRVTAGFPFGAPRRALRVLGRRDPPP